MAGGGEDKHSKKHPASAKKKKDLKKKGTVPKSQDVPMALGLAAAFGAMMGLKGPITERFQALMGEEGYFAAIAGRRNGGRDPVQGARPARDGRPSRSSASRSCSRVLVMAFPGNLAQTASSSPASR